MKVKTIALVVAVVSTVGLAGCNGSGGGGSYDVTALFNSVAMLQACESSGSGSGFESSAQTSELIWLGPKISEDTRLKIEKGTLVCQMNARSCDEYNACATTPVNCSSVGLISGPGGTCVAGKCSGSSYCDGVNLVTCAGGYKTISDCTFQWSGKTVCSSSGSSPECARPISRKSYCDGNTVVEIQDGVTTRFDCSIYDTAYTCFVDKEYPNTVLCGNPNPTCIFSETNPETCKDGVVSFCFHEKPASYDCKKSGFSGCTAQSGRAACVK